MRCCLTHGVVALRWHGVQVHNLSIAGTQAPDLVSSHTLGQLQGQQNSRQQGHKRSDIEASMCSARNSCILLLLCCFLLFEWLTCTAWMRQCASCVSLQRADCMRLSGVIIYTDRHTRAAAADCTPRKHAVTTTANPTTANAAARPATMPRTQMEPCTHTTPQSDCKHLSNEQFLGCHSNQHAIFRTPLDSHTATAGPQEGQTHPVHSRQTATGQHVRISVGTKQAGTDRTTNGRTWTRHATE